MNEHEINHLKKKLLSEKNTVRERQNTNQIYIDNSNIKDDLGELSSYDNHPADHGSELFEKEKRYALKKHGSRHLDEIEDSLKRIQDGNYGICDICDREIGFDRLNALPIAKLCIDCQKNKRDPHDWDDDRPIEEDNFAYPFGRTFTDDTDSVIFDGEDAWQGVQRYGSSSGPQDISVNRLIDYRNVYVGSQERVGETTKMDSITRREYQEQWDREDLEDIEDMIEEP